MQLPEKTRLQNDLLCIELDIKPYTLTYNSLPAKCVVKWIDEMFMPAFDLYRHYCL